MEKISPKKGVVTIIWAMNFEPNDEWKFIQSRGIIFRSHWDAVECLKWSMHWIRIEIWKSMRTMEKKSHERGGVQESVCAFTIEHER